MDHFRIIFEWWIVFLRFGIVRSKRLLVAFNFYFLPAVVVGIVVTGTEIRAQACMSAKAAATCEYQTVDGLVDLPIALGPVDVAQPPNPHHRWAPGHNCYVYSLRCMRLFSAPWDWFMSGSSVMDRPSLLNHTDQEKSECHCERGVVKRGDTVAVLAAPGVVLS